MKRNFHDLLGGCSSQFPKRASIFGWPTRSLVTQKLDKTYITSSRSHSFAVLKIKGNPRKNQPHHLTARPWNVTCPKGKDGCPTIHFSGVIVVINFKVSNSPKTHGLSFKWWFSGFHVRVMAAGSILVLGVSWNINLCKTIGFSSKKSDKKTWRTLSGIFQRNSVQNVSVSTCGTRFHTLNFPNFTSFPAELHLGGTGTVDGFKKSDPKKAVEVGSFSKNNSYARQRILEPWAVALCSSVPKKNPQLSAPNGQVCTVTWSSLDLIFSCSDFPVVRIAAQVSNAI